jgi:AbrB family looped-hinge helix DNA binding protein
MTAAVITSKGQITIPVDVRRRLGLGAGDRIEFVEIEKGLFAIRPATGDVRALKGMIKAPAKPVTIEDMNEAILDRAVERSRR